MATPRIERFIGDEDELWIWWFRNGSLIDFSQSGYTYQAKLASSDDTTTVLFTKTTGFTGAAGSGVPSNGTPNLVVQFATSGELNTIMSAGTYVLEVKATAASGAETTIHITVVFKKRLG